jgi:hypothetical protein
MAEKTILNRKEATAYLIQRGVLVGSRTLQRWAKWDNLGGGPAHFRVKHKCFYKKEDLDKWMEKEVRRIE